MKTARSWIEIAAIMAAATVGDGIFAMPYVFYKAGWLLGLFYLAALSAVVMMAHVIYLRTLEKVGEKERLLGLVKKYFGAGGFWVGFLGIVVGLILGLVAYIVIGARFLTLLFPAIDPSIAMTVFWAAVSIPLLLSDRKAVDLEMLGILSTAFIIVFIFARAWPNIGFFGAPVAVTGQAFLPFGVLLLALAGWTGVEPAYEAAKRAGLKRPSGLGIALGTGFAACLYLLFVLGVFGSSGTITPDTVSGLTGWPAWERTIVAVLGMLAVWTAYMPISREIKHSFDKDLGWSGTIATAFLVIVPPLIIFLGVNNFFAIVSFIGGTFISLQYLLIVSVGRRALTLSPAARFGLDAVALAFVVAAIYQIYLFVVR